MPEITDAEAAEVIKSLNARMLAAILMPPFTLGPAPLMCPVCGTTRDACLRFYGRDRQHEEAIRAALDELRAEGEQR